MNGFVGLRVLALESRRAQELAKLISNYGGEPVVAPAMREVPLDSNTEALSFAEALLAGQFDMVIFLTGVGTRAVLGVAEAKHPREALIATLRRVKVVPRGPKPIAVLREPSGINRVGIRLTAREDDGHAGTHGSFADLE